MGRSRSPRGKNGWSDWISRQVASFGRHPQKRPRGLSVDGNGNMWLEQLMSSWGRGHDLQEQEVLSAVQENMFHEDGMLRFSIDTDQQGNIKIRVLPKRERGSHGGCGTPRGGKGSSGSGGGTPRGGKGGKDGKGGAQWVWVPTPKSTPPPRRAPVMRGSVLESMQTPAKVGEPTAATSTSKKLDMSLDEVIRENGNGSQGPMRFHLPEMDMQLPNGRTAHHAQQAERVHRSMEQMGHTSSSSGVRLPPRSAARKGFGKRGEGGGRNRGNGKGAWGGQRERARSASPLDRHRNHDISRSPTPEDKDDDELAARCGQSLNLASATERRPSPPGGRNSKLSWTKYEDEGTIWWFYEGALGKWWCKNNAAASEVEKWASDGEEEE